jgi:hypothetical protein
MVAIFEMMAMPGYFQDCFGIAAWYRREPHTAG